MRDALGGSVRGVGLIEELDAHRIGDGVELAAAHASVADLLSRARGA